MRNLLSMFLLSFSCFGIDVDKTIKELDHESFEIREKANELLISLDSSYVLKFLLLSHENRLSNPEVSYRLYKIAKTIYLEKLIWENDQYAGHFGETGLNLRFSFSDGAEDRTIKIKQLMLAIANAKSPQEAAELTEKLKRYDNEGFLLIVHMSEFLKSNKELKRFDAVIVIDEVPIVDRHNLTDLDINSSYNNIPPNREYKLKILRLKEAKYKELQELEERLTFEEICELACKKIINPENTEFVDINIKSYQKDDLKVDWESVNVIKDRLWSAFIIEKSLDIKDK